MKYKVGDIFNIALSNHKYAICKLIFAPRGALKQVIGLVVYDIVDYDNRYLFDLNNHKLKKFKIMNNFQEIIFTGNQKIKNGEWKFFAYKELNKHEIKLQTFQYAGDLYNNENLVGKIKDDEFQLYTRMSVCGFELLDNIIISSSN